MANVILTNLSTIHKDALTYAYQSDLGVIEGIHTNEAPVKYLIAYLTEHKEKVNKIILVVTQEAASAYDYFCHMLELYNQKQDVVLPSPVKIFISGETIAETIQKIVKNISSDDRVYIDTTGGFRNASYLLMGVVRVLEYSNIRLEMAVYSNFQKKRIENISDLYKMFNLINAVSIFTSFGNSCELEEYFRNTENDIVKRTIQAMKAFSDEIMLCRTSKLNPTIKTLSHCLGELSQVESNVKDIILFKSLIETIRFKFYVDVDKIEYPDIVCWCLDNKLVQQAVTIYVEKMPEYFLQNGVLSPLDSFTQSKKNRIKGLTLIIRSSMI